MGMAEAEALVRERLGMFAPAEPPPQDPSMFQQFMSEALRYAPLGAGPFGRGGPPPALPSSRYAPNPGQRYTLGQNAAQDPRFEYPILNRGEPVGQMTGRMEGLTGHTANIEAIGAGGGPLGGTPNTLGAAAMRQLLQELRRDYPNVVRAEGYRTSGARATEEALRRARGILQNLPKQRVDIP